MPTRSAATQSNTGLQVDLAQLLEFETRLNPEDPESSGLPCRVLGYGEISTVFQILTDAFRGLALKRMSIFENREELDAYLLSYQEYHRLLEGDLGIKLPRNGYAHVENAAGRPIFYIIQEQVPAAHLGSQAIHTLPPEGALQLCLRALRESNKVWEYNRQGGPIRIAIDGQISNWALSAYDPQTPELPPTADLLYLDTSTPIYQINGVEQLDPELFLRSGPSFMAAIIRRFFLPEVMARYYEPRQVIIDLVANLIKEGQAALIPPLVAAANHFLAEELAYLALDPLTEAEIRAYYREDALIWRFYAAMRRVDRFLHQITGRKYPYILPGNVSR